MNQELIHYNESSYLSNSVEQQESFDSKKEYINEPKNQSDISTSPTTTIITLSKGSRCQMRQTTSCSLKEDTGIIINDKQILSKASSKPTRLIKFKTVKEGTLSQQFKNTLRKRLTKFNRYLETFKIGYLLFDKTPESSMTIVDRVDNYDTYLISSVEDFNVHEYCCLELNDCNLNDGQQDSRQLLKLTQLQDEKKIDEAKKKWKSKISQNFKDSYGIPNLRNAINMKVEDILRECGVEPSSCSLRSDAHKMELNPELTFLEISDMMEAKLLKKYLKKQAKTNPVRTRTVSITYDHSSFRSLVLD